MFDTTTGSMSFPSGDLADSSIIAYPFTGSNSFPVPQSRVDFTIVSTDGSRTLNACINTSGRILIYSNGSTSYGGYKITFNQLSYSTNGYVEYSY